MTTVLSIEDVRRSPKAVLFEGRDEVPLSFFVTEFERGEGPSLHLHPYPEVFLIETGTGAFTVDGKELVVAAGHIVVVPANTPHAFKGAGPDTLRVVSIQPSGTPQQTWLDDDR
jgi:quercetin dioxygenase-like cupin family protein